MVHQQARRAPCHPSVRPDPSRALYRHMRKRRRLIAIIVIVTFVATLLATALPALAVTIEGHEVDDSSPAVQLPRSPLPPTAPGVADGQRVYVRTSAATPTEYMLVRQAIVDAGFPDVLEVSPGTLLVDIGNTAGLSKDDAIVRLSELEMVVEIADAPAYEVVSGTEEVRYLSWGFVLIAGIVVLFAGLALVRRLDTSRPVGTDIEPAA